MMFSHLLGNEPIKAYLQRALQTGALHHTLLFNGPDGIGKSLFAKELAAALMKADAKRIREENHPDFHILRPESKSGLYSIEQLREMIDEMHKPPFEAEAKIFLLHDAHRMQPAAANVLLKTLEEPDLDSTLILLTSAAHEILPTILSRCVQLNFQPISEELIASHLQRTVDPERARRLARHAHGSLGSALASLANDRREKAERLLFDALSSKTPPFHAIEAIDALFDDLEGIEYQKEVDHLLAAYLMWVRDQELRRSAGDERLLYFPEEKPSQSVSLSAAESTLAEIKTALERNVRLSACLDQIFSEANQ